MAYTKQHFEDGQILKAEHLNNIEDGILQMYDDIINDNGNIISGVKLIDGNMPEYIYENNIDLGKITEDGFYHVKLPYYNGVCLMDSDGKNLLRSNTGSIENMEFLMKLEGGNMYFTPPLSFSSESMYDGAIVTSINKYSKDARVISCRSYSLPWSI